MAGHSKFKNIMHRKGAKDKQRARTFSKITRELMVAARQGIDPQFNPQLRAVLALARSARVPKENIERVLKKMEGGEEGANYEEVRYEGYGPGGTALIVESLTDNRNRTAAEIRTAFSKNGGNLGETGSVNYLFQRIGMIHYKTSEVAFEELFNYAVEKGADSVEEEEDILEVTCSVDLFTHLRDGLQETFGDPQEAKLIWRPHVTIPCDEKTASSVLKLIETLEDNDDVQNVYSNFDIEEEILSKLTA